MQYQNVGPISYTEYIAETLAHTKLEWEEIYSENILIKMLELCIT